jgi:hypothetical protein
VAIIRSSGGTIRMISYSFRTYSRLHASMGSDPVPLMQRMVGTFTLVCESNVPQVIHNP